MADKTAVAQQFQRILGRPPRPEEIEYFTEFLDEGTLRLNDVGTILQSLPEYQQSTLAPDTAKFSDVLRSGDEALLNQAAGIAGAQAQSRFAGLGRPNTSALASQVFGQTGQFASQLGQSRQAALADFYGRGLAGARGAQFDAGQGALARGQGLRDERRQRGFQLEDYYRQQNDFNTAQNARSGFRALTPEFLTSQVVGLGGQALGGFLGGLGQGKGLAKGLRALGGAK